MGYLCSRSFIHPRGCSRSRRHQQGSFAGNLPEELTVGLAGSGRCRLAPREPMKGYRGLGEGLCRGEPVRTEEGLPDRRDSLGKGQM